MSWMPSLDNKCVLVYTWLQCYGERINLGVGGIITGKMGPRGH